MEISREVLEAIKQAQEGKEEGFNRIYSSTYRYVFFKTKSIMKNEDEAWDLLQEVYIIAYKSISKLERPENLYAWLGGIAYNMGMKAFRKKKNIILEEEDEGLFDNIPSTDKDIQPEEYVEDKQTTIIVKELIDGLPELQKAAVIAYYFDELSVKDIAMQFECSEGTIKSRLNYARQYLKQSVEQREKKDGIKLHSVTIPTILIALRMLSEEVSVSAQVAQTIYNRICESFGLQASLITTGIAGISNLEGAALSTTQTASATTEVAGVTAKTAGVTVKATGLVGKIMSATTGIKALTITVTAVVGATSIFGGIAFYNSRKPIPSDSRNVIATPTPTNEIDQEIDDISEEIDIDIEEGMNVEVSVTPIVLPENNQPNELMLDDIMLQGEIVHGITDSIETGYKKGDHLTDEQKMAIAHQILSFFCYSRGNRFSYEEKEVKYSLHGSEDVTIEIGFVIPREDIDVLLNTILGNTISEEKDYDGFIYDDNQGFYLYHSEQHKKRTFNSNHIEVLSSEITENKKILEIVRKLEYKDTNGSTELIQEDYYLIEFDLVQESKFGKYSLSSFEKIIK